MHRYAVIDLGTNTFHLLIVERGPMGQIQVLKRVREFVKLAESGIYKIGLAPYLRGIEALKYFKTFIHEYGATEVKAFGTAALRTASNGMAFVRDVEKLTGISVKLIPGDREAELIYKGVKLAVPFKHDSKLIMDIGGGSVEFIIANEEKLHWAQSFPVGVAVLFNDFHKNDPIKKDEIRNIEQHLEASLEPLFDALKVFPVQHLVGASGTFDVLENVILEQKDHNTLYSYIDAQAFFPFFDIIINTSLQERLSMSGIPEKRVDLIIVALILLHFIIRKAAIQQIVVSAYAMKEGMLLEMMEKN